MNFAIVANGVEDLKRQLVDMSLIRTALEIEHTVKQMKEDRLEHEHYLHTHFEDGCDLCWKEREQCANDLY